MIHIHKQLAIDKKGNDSLVSTTARVFGTLDQTKVRVFVDFELRTTS